MLMFNVRQQPKAVIAIAGSIIIMIVLSAFLGLTIKQDEMIRHYVHHSAASYFDSIIMTRRWSANYGGVYVEKKEGMCSNPYLENPDVTADDGRVYTLKNPALITRELSEMAARMSDYRYHITSLKTMNPGNAPDEWERAALLSFERGEKEARQIIEKDGKSVFRLMRPIYYEQGCVKCHNKQGYSIGNVRGGISVTIPYDEIAAELQQNRIKMFGLAGGILLLLGVLFYLVIWKLVERISTTSKLLEEQKQELQQLNADLDRRIEERTRELAAANERLREEILERERVHKSLMESEMQLRHSHKLEAIGQLSSGVAHDFNNILTVIAGYSELIQSRQTPGSEDFEMTGQISRAAERAANLTRSLLAFSRKQAMEPDTVNLNDIITNVDKFLRRIIGEGITLTTKMNRNPIPVYADHGQIEQVIINLATNARDAMNGDGRLSIETDITEIDDSFVASHGYGAPGDYAVMLVSDTGAGMDKEACSRIFEPFYTTKETGKGTGLGLSIVHGIITQHKGFISVYSEPGIGTTFRVIIPLHDGESTLHREPESAPANGTETILLAEDDDSVRTLIRQILEGYGYQVLEAGNGREAVDIFRIKPGEIDLIISDVIMPVKNGVDAAHEIQAIRPEIKVLFTSGYTADIIRDRSELDENFDLIMKPIHPVKLARKVRDMLDAE